MESTCTESALGTLCKYIPSIISRTASHRIVCALKCISSFRNYFQYVFRDKIPILNSKIQCIVNCFVNKHHINDAPYSGRLKVLTAEMKEVHVLIEAIPYVSLRKLPWWVHMSTMSVRRTLKKLSNRPYRATMCQKLKPDDHRKYLVYWVGCYTTYTILRELLIMCFSLTSRGYIDSVT